VAPTKETKGAASSRSPRVESVLNSHLPHGADRWRFVEVYPVAEIGRDVKAQSRLSLDLDKRYVTELAEKVRSGVVLDPIVLWETETNGDLCIEGNHRVAAYGKRGIPTTPAYLVKIASVEEARYLSAVFNAAHGKRLDPDALRQAVIAAGKMTPEPTMAQLAKDYGVSASQIGKIRAEADVRHRFEALGVAGSASVSQGVALPLAKIALDEPLRQATQLVLDAGMSATDTRHLVGEVIKASSEAGQLDAIRRARIERAEDIATVASGRKASGAPVSDLRRAIAMIEKAAELTPDPAAWVTADDTLVHPLGTRVDAVATFLMEVAEQYRVAAAASTAADEGESAA
jgi:hypothetical protein